MTNKGYKKMIYFIENKDDNVVKIGYTQKAPDKRLRQLQTSNHKKLEITYTINGDISKEKGLHRKFNKYRLSGEWFSLSEEIKIFMRTNCNKYESKKSLIGLIKTQPYYDILLDILKGGKEVSIKLDELKEGIFKFQYCSIITDFTNKERRCIEINFHEYEDIPESTCFQFYFNSKYEVELVVYSNSYGSYRILENNEWDRELVMCLGLDSIPRRISLISKSSD